MMQQAANQNIPAAPDETGYFMPIEGRTDSWVYGDPSQNQPSPSLSPINPMPCRFLSME